MQQDLQVKEQLGYVDPITVYRKKLGKGQYGTVYLCQYKEEQCAAKYLLKSQFVNEKQNQVLQREFDLLDKLKHQNIIEKKYLYEDEEKYVIILEYCDTSLKKFIDEQQAKMEREEINIDQHIQICINYIDQIIQGLNYLYENNVEHRDLKPDNILIKDNQIKIADFGFAKQMEKSNQLDVQTQLGTKLYSSPQCFNNYQDKYQVKYSIKCDIWSLGVILYEMIYLDQLFKHVYQIQNIQQKPFDFKDSEETTQVLQENYPKIAKLIKRMIQYDEKDRISMEDLIEYNLYDKNQQQEQQQQQQHSQNNNFQEEQKQEVIQNNINYVSNNYQYQNQNINNNSQQYEGEQIIGNAPKLFNFLNQLEQNRMQNQEEMKSQENEIENIDSNNDNQQQQQQQYIQQQQINNIHQIQILKAEEKISTPKNYVTYKIETKINGRQETVNRRFSEFKAFISYYNQKAIILNLESFVIPYLDEGDMYYNQLATNVKSLISQVQSKQTQEYVDTPFIQKRLKDLDYFLQQCLQISFIKNDVYFKNFLTQQDFKIEDSLLQKSDISLSKSQNQSQQQQQQQNSQQPNVSVYDYQDQENKSLVDSMSGMWNSFKNKTKATVTTLVNDSKDSEIQIDNKKKITDLGKVKTNLQNALKSSLGLNEVHQIGTRFIINLIKSVEQKQEYFIKQKKSLRFNENLAEELKSNIQSQQQQKEYENLQQINNKKKQILDQSEMTFNQILEQVLSDCKNNLSEILKLQSINVSQNN